MTALNPAISWVVLAVTLVAAWTDIRSRRIPNWLVSAGFIAGFGLNAWLSGWQGLAGSMLGFGAALLVYIPLFTLRAMGGGDVKLMAAVGSLVGPQNWFVIFVLASLAGGVAALGLILARSAGGEVLRNVLHILKELIRFRMPFRARPDLDVGHERAFSVPHAVAIFAGSLAFLYLR